MSNWMTEMSLPNMFDFNVYETANSDNGNVGEYVTQTTQGARSNTFQPASFSELEDDMGRRHLIPTPESLPFPFCEYVQIPSQLATNGLGVSKAKASQQTRNGYRLQCPNDWTEMYPVSQTSGSDSSGLTQSGTTEQSLFSQLSIPSEQQEDGGNSHLPEGDIAQLDVDSKFDFWGAPHRTDSYHDANISQPMFQLYQSQNNSRRRSGIAISPSYAASNIRPVRVRREPASKAIPGQQVNAHDRHVRRHASTGSNDVGNVSASLHSPGLVMIDSSPDGAYRGAFMGKRKRTDGGPETVLEGIFIVTHRPNNGKMSRIADLIGWDFEDVNDWFDSRAQWEASHTSSTRSQNTNVPSGSNTINILPQDQEDSGFFELPDNSAIARRPKKRPKHQTTLVNNKTEDENDHEANVEMKTYLCIHEACSHSFAKFGEWKRHMASVHYPDRWACLLKEKGQPLPTDFTCSFCETSFMSVRDLKEHMHLFTGCQDTNFVCVFDRKDKLGAHWKRCHEFESRLGHLGDGDLCVREIRDFDRNCGFCELAFTNWDNKIEHVGAHFRDEGLKMSSWRYPHYKDGRHTLRRPLNDGQVLSGDEMFDSDAGNSDSDDSDDDDAGDRPKLHAYNRRNNRDRDKDGNSGPGTFFPPPSNDDHAGSGNSSSQNSSYGSKTGKDQSAGNYGFSARKGEVDAVEISLTAEYSDSYNVPLFSLGAMPAFKSIRSLGHGGFGLVDEICIEGTNQIVARKRIQRFPGQARKFTIELEMIRKLRTLDHPHIVRFLGSYITNTHIDVLMSPVADYDLNEFMLQQYPPVPIAIKTLIAGFYGCLVSGLKYIHKRNIRHRDIKPKNILIANGVCLIADFGSAIDTSHEARNEYIGITPKYTAPEAFSSGRHGLASDVWSLGCVFMEMATIVHDKTLFELEAFRSSNAKFNTVQNFHETAGKLNDWLKFLPRLSATPPLTWQGIGYLETISEMLQYDEIKRPSASELLPRFPPSHCCSMAADGVKISYPSVPSEFLKLGRKDRISLAISRSWEENAFPELARGTDLRQSLIDCSNLGRKSLLEAAEVVRLLCSGSRSTSDEIKKNTSSESKPALLGTHASQRSCDRSERFVGFSPKEMSTVAYYASVDRLNEKYYKLVTQKTMEYEEGEDTIECSYPTSIGMRTVSIDGNIFNQLNQRTSKDSTAIIGLNEGTFSLAKDDSDMKRLKSACDGYDVPLGSESWWSNASDLQPISRKNRLNEQVGRWCIINHHYFLSSPWISPQVYENKPIYKLPVFFDQTEEHAISPLHTTAGVSEVRIVKQTVEELVGINNWAAVNHGGKTPLHRAALRGNKAMVQLLLDNGANIEAKTRNNMTPLHFAALNSHDAVVRLLLDHGADIEAKDNEDRKPLLRHHSQYTENVRSEMTMNSYREACDEWKADEIKCEDDMCKAPRDRYDERLKAHENFGFLYTITPLQAAYTPDSIDLRAEEDRKKRLWATQEAALQSSLRQIRKCIQTDVYNPVNLRIDIPPENILKPINSREILGRNLDSRLYRYFVNPRERSKAPDYRICDLVQLLKSASGYFWWNEHFPAETGIFLLLSGSEKFPVSKWKDLKDKIEELFESPKEIFWRHNLDNWNICKPEDDQMGRDKAPSTATKCYLDTLYLPGNHSEDLRRYILVDCLDESTRNLLLEQYRRDPSIDWSRLRPDRNDVAKDGHQLQIIFHWWKCLHEKSAGRNETLKVSNNHGHGDDFIQIFMGTPERLKEEIEGCSTANNSPNSNPAGIEFCCSCLLGSDFGVGFDNVLVIASISSSSNIN